MAITNFIPTVWSETLLCKLDDSYVGVSNCTREFEGEIREKGNRVKIVGLNSVVVENYTKNTDISAPSALSDSCTELLIDQAKYFNFQIDDIDRAQANPSLMEAALKSAACALSAAADTHVYSLIARSDSPLRKTVTVDNVIDELIDARTVLLRRGVNDPSEIVIEVAPEIGALIMKAKIALSTDNTDSLEHGCIGSIGGSKVFVSPHLGAGTTSEGACYTCALRTRRAIAFAEQLSEVEAYRPEHRFADAMKGLHLYGAAIVRPQELLAMVLTIPTASAVTAASASAPTAAVLADLKTEGPSAE